MNRVMLTAAFALAIVPPCWAQKSDTDKLQGVWEITALVDDGALVPDDMIRTRFAHDARFTINGQSISFLNPGTLQKRSVLYVLDEKASPKTIDLAGTEKTNGKGIYLLTDDVLMICLAETGANQRPTEFSAKQGSPHLLLTLKRIKESEARPAQPAPMPPSKDTDMRQSLLGTWGHQDEDWITLMTLNKDGTFSASRTYKKKFGKLFHEDVRSSGNWKLQDGVIISTITASTESDLRNQVYSFRIRSISPTELIAVDQFGKLRREWKTR